LIPSRLAKNLEVYLFGFDSLKLFTKEKDKHLKDIEEKRKKIIQRTLNIINSK